MATLLDAIGFLQQFGFYSTILPFLLVAAGMYALLTKLKPFGDLKGVNAIISIVIGFIFVSMVRAVTFLNKFIPLFTTFLLLLVLAYMVFIFVGVKSETITELFTKNPAFAGIFILIILILVIVVLSQVFPEATFIVQYPEVAEELNLTLYGANATPQEKAALYGMAQVFRIVTSPQIMALIILFVVFGLAAYFITREKK